MPPSGPPVRKYISRLIIQWVEEALTSIRGFYGFCTVTVSLLPQSMLESASISQVVSSLSPSSQLRHARLLIGGTWKPGDSTFEVRDKTTGQLIGTCEAASRAQVDEAVASANVAFRENRLE